jgi:carbonic anhydrase
MDGAVYYAEEIVIHTPAEHTIQGKKYDMELQIIHYGQSKGDISKQIVLSFLFERTPGEVNPFIEDLNYFDLPNPTSTERDIEEPLFIPKLLSRLDDVANVVSMEPFSFFTYQGSLTFPPCTEDTIMYVASNPLKIGTTALQLFQEAQRIPDLMDERGNVIISDWSNQSFRKTQPLNGRPVYHFNHAKYCPPIPQKTKEEKGHYEKIQKVVSSYFHVGGNEPSGMPNAYVVSENEALGTGKGPK